MEFGIAAALSGDPKMQAAYRSGDVYLEFAKQAGAAPAHATQETHESVRALFKAVSLGTLYGMEYQSLALRIGGSQALARDLLKAHHETYPVFWRWSDAVVTTAMLHNKLQTVFGWTINLDKNPNIRSLRNVCMQANGGECMRVAAILIDERGVPAGAVIHDAFGVCSSLEPIRRSWKPPCAKPRALYWAALNWMCRVQDVHLAGAVLGQTRGGDVEHGDVLARTARAQIAPDGGRSKKDRDMDGMDLADIRLPDAWIPVRRVEASPARTGKNRFVMVPFEWVSRLQGASGQTYGVALQLLYRTWKESTDVIKLGNAGPRRSKWRALVDLERRGLVEVERRPKQSPLVRILFRRFPKS
jgi:hypothetical protein